MKCPICKLLNQHGINHHISYSPEITIKVCQSCHQKIHRNPVEFKKYLKHTEKEKEKFYSNKIWWSNYSKPIPEDPRHQKTVTYRGYF